MAVFVNSVGWASPSLVAPLAIGFADDEVVTPRLSGLVRQLPMVVISTCCGPTLAATYVDVMSKLTAVHGH